MSTDQLLDNPESKTGPSLLTLDDLGDRPLVPGDIVVGLETTRDISTLEHWLIAQIDPDVRLRHLRIFNEPLPYAFRQGFTGEIRNGLAVVVPPDSVKIKGKKAQNEAELIEAGQVVSLVLDGIIYSSAVGVAGSISRAVMYRRRNDRATPNDTVARVFGKDSMIREGAEYEANPVVRARKVARLVVGRSIPKQSA